MDRRKNERNIDAAVIETVLRDSDVIKSRDAIVQLDGLTFDDDALKLIAKSTTDIDPEVRRRAVRLCHVLRAGDVLALLSKSLVDPVWTVREAAAITLASARSAETSQLLVRCALRDKSHFVRDAAVRSLVLLHELHENIVAEFVSALSNSKPPVRCRAANGLVQFQDHVEQFLPALVKQTDDSHHRVRKTAVTAMGQIASTSSDAQLASTALPALIARRYDGDDRVRESALLAIERVLKSSSEHHIALFGALQSNPAAALRTMWKSTDVPAESKREFEQLCHNRRKWWSDKLKEPTVEETDETNASDSSPIATVMNLTDNQRRESAWLLRRFADIILTNWRFDGRTV